jgi:plastocyanin
MEVHMNRRLKVAIVATATFGAVAPAAGAAQANEIRIIGGTVFEAGKFVKDDVRFAPRRLTVKRNATVTLRNRGTDPAPHTISFVKKAFLPKSFEFAAIGPLMAAHQVDQENEEAPPAVIKVDNGVAAADQNAPLQVNTGGDDKQAGDSQFIAPGQKRITFKVTARSGSTLRYYCAIHPWMQGKILVD